MKKIKQTIEVTKYFDDCKKCGKTLRGSSEAMVRGNLKIHLDSRECKK